MLELPKTNKDVASMLDHLRSTAETFANRYKVQWSINNHWLRGARSFYPNYETGQLQAIYRHNQQDRTGQLQLRYEDTVVKRQAEIGRLMQMDIRPTAGRKGFGLSSLRKASSARVMLDYLTSGVDYEKLKFAIFSNLTDYGTCGVAAWPRSKQVEDAAVGADPDSMAEKQLLDEAIESKVILEPIVPWQLLPIPHNPVSPGDLEGIVRRRWVPLPWLRRRGLKLPQDSAILRSKPSAYGVRPDVDDPVQYGQESLKDQARDYARSLGKAGETDVEYVMLEEWWTYQEDRSRLAQYIVKVGDHIALKETYKTRSHYVPIDICQYYPGGFFGRSYVELLIPLNSEVEIMAQNLFQNVKDLDSFGILMVPKGLGVSRTELLEQKNKRKVVTYQPDLTLPDAKPFSIDPHNTGDFPGKVLSFGNQLMDRMGNQSEMMRGKAPGRIDSEAGMSYLHEQNNIPLTVPAASVANCMAQIYKAVLAYSDSLMGDRGEIPLIGLDESILGLKVKPNSGLIELDPNNYPKPFEVEIGVRDRLPVAPSLKEQKLMTSLKMGIITPRQFRIQVWKENLDFPVANEAERESYRKAMLQVVLLFNDGETPGQNIMGNLSADLPEVALEVIQSFMAKVEFQFATEQVRSAFEELKQNYTSARGTYPDAMPYPEDAAQMAQQMGMGGGMPGGPGMPPMGMMPGMG